MYRVSPGTPSWRRIVRYCESHFERHVAAGLMLATTVYLLHIVTRGEVLGSQVYCIIMVCLAWIVIVRLPIRGALRHAALPQSDWVFLGILFSLVFFILWAGRNGFSGDYLVHHEYVAQLLNGFTRGHLFYKDYPGYYPLLTHVIVALGCRLTGLSIHRSFFLFALGAGWLAVLASYRLAAVMGLTRLASFFFAGLICLYGGCWTATTNVTHFYMPAVQLMMPFFSRNLGFIVFLIFLGRWRSLWNAKASTRDEYCILGFYLGCLGLIHPNHFAMANVLCGVLTGYRILKRSGMQRVVAAWVFGMGMSTLYYAPLVWDWVLLGGFKQGDRKPVVLPSDPWMYLPVGLFALYSLFQNRNRKNFWWNVGVTVTAVMFMMLIGMLFCERLDVLLRPFRFQRFGVIAFVFYAILAVWGCEALALRLPKICLLGIVMAVLSLGARANILYGKSIYGYRWSKVSRMLAGKVAWFPKGKADAMGELHLADVLRKQTLLVPVTRNRFARKVAFYYGLDVAYVDKGPIIEFQNYYRNTLSPMMRKRYVQKFYFDLENGVLRSDILSVFETSSFLSRNKHLASMFEVDNLGCIHFDHETWYYYTQYTCESVPL